MQNYTYNRARSAAAALAGYINAISPLSAKMMIAAGAIIAVYIAALPMFLAYAVYFGEGVAVLRAGEICSYVAHSMASCACIAAAGALFVDYGKKQMSAQ